MADNTIIQQGSFVSDGLTRTLQIRSDIDWMRVVNYTKAGATSAADGVEFYWQRGMALNDGFVYKRPAGTIALGLTTAASLAVGGFTLVDTSTSALGNPVAITAVSTAAVPVVSTASTAGLSAGDVVRLTTVSGAGQIGGMDFTIGTIVDNTSFTLPYMSQLAVAGTTGFYRKVNTSPKFYPARRLVSSITNAANAVVTTTAAHGYTAGQVVRVLVPAAYGMTQMDSLLGTITAVTSNTFTLNIDSSTFTAFAFPLAGAMPFTFAEVIPVGQSTQEPYASSSADATVDTGYIGMILAAGAASPAGSNNDVIYWTAGRSFSNS